MKIDLNPQARIRALEAETIQQYEMLLEQVRTIDKLHSAIIKTLDENGHLADGENCTLIHLKRAVGYE